ncbi:hypothetical protein RRG08_025287 [Elysia crispata]|uniref:Uncharacterized protein n=1 Tax=Elysia crispata TaxID=231223 RepID=A0AAE1DYU3_9GAST|nr:hypothetical protein RRG08_025287 [Elysia crispata]
MSGTDYKQSRIHSTCQVLITSIQDSLNMSGTDHKHPGFTQHVRVDSTCQVLITNIQDPLNMSGTDHKHPGFTQHVRIHSTCQVLITSTQDSLNMSGTDYKHPGSAQHIRVSDIFKPFDKASLYSRTESKSRHTPNSSITGLVFLARR